MKIVSRCARAERASTERASSSIDPEMMGDHPFMDLLASACRGEYGASIKPTAGMALQFEHILPDGSYNRDTWHDGCNVLSGAKITLQKFKELPAEHRQPGDKVQKNPPKQKIAHTHMHPSSPQSGRRQAWPLKGLCVLRAAGCRVSTRLTVAFTRARNFSRSLILHGILMPAMLALLSMNKTTTMHQRQQQVRKRSF